MTDPTYTRPQLARIWTRTGRTELTTTIATNDPFTTFARFQDYANEHHADTRVLEFLPSGSILAKWTKTERGTTTTYKFHFFHAPEHWSN